MKKLLMISVLALSLFAFAGASAQQKDNSIFSGMKYTNDAAGVKTIGLQAGYGFKVVGVGFGDVWSFNSVEFGFKKLNSLAPDFALLVKVAGDTTKTKVFIGLIAAPNVDYVTLEGEGYTAYINGATGGLIFLKFPKEWGFYLMGKYKFALKDGTLFQDGFQSGFGLFKNFSF